MIVGSVFVQTTFLWRFKNQSLNFLINKYKACHATRNGGRSKERKRWLPSPTLLMVIVYAHGTCFMPAKLTLLCPLHK